MLQILCNTDNASWGCQQKNKVRKLSIKFVHGYLVFYFEAEMDECIKKMDKEIYTMYT